MCAARVDTPLRPRALRPIVLLNFYSLFFLTGAWPADPYKAVVKIQAEGCAEGTSTSSRDAAVVAARRDAVRLWLEGELGALPERPPSEMMDALDRYTASSRLLRVQPREGRTCVELEVYLYEWALRTDLAKSVLATRATKPSVALLIVETDATKNARAFQEQSRTFPLLVKALALHGLEVLPGTTGTAYSERELVSILEGGPASLARYGVERGAEAVIAVETTLSADVQGPDRRALRARAHLRAFVVGAADGRLLDQSEASAEIDGTDAAAAHGFALSDAVFKVQDRAIIAAIMAAGAGAAKAQRRLTVDGLTDFVAAERVAELLRGTAGVTGAELVSVRGGAALIHFEFAGRMGPLVDTLLAGGAGLPRLDVVEVAGNELRLKALP